MGTLWTAEVVATSNKDFLDTVYTLLSAEID